MKIIFLLLTLLSARFLYAATNTKYDVFNMTMIDKSKVEFNGVGVTGTVPAKTVDHIIDYDLTDDNFITGAKMMTTGSCADDRIKLQINMGDNLVKRFIDWYSMDMDTQIPYPSKVPAGLKIRALYTNTCDTSVKVRINYHLHRILE